MFSELVTDFDLSELSIIVYFKKEKCLISIFVIFICISMLIISNDVTGDNEAKQGKTEMLKDISEKFGGGR